jgi:tetratricopeptide (TPR) repeat protein
LKTHRDDLPEELGQKGQGQDLPEDPRWEALAMGLLSDEEAAALRVEAEASEEGRRKYELYRPFDAAEAEASVDAMLGKLPGRAASRPDAAAPPQREAPVPGASPLPLPAPRRWAARRSAAAALLAMAAALALFLARPGEKPFPHFDAETNGGEKSQRGEPPSSTSTLRLSDPRSHGKVTLTPPSALAELPTARTLLLHDGALWKQSPCEAMVSASKIEIDCLREDIGAALPPGKWTLLIALGWFEALPKDDARLMAAPEQTTKEPSRTGFQVVRVPIDFGDPRGASAVPLEVELAGCGLLRTLGEESVCELPRSHTLSLWIKSARGVTLTRTLDGKPLEAPGKAVQEGELFTLEGIPDEARALVVEASDHGLSAPPHRLVLAPYHPRAALEEVDSLRGDPATRPRARDLATGLLTHEDPVIRALATGKLARIERASEKVGAAVARFREALALDRAAGLISAEVDDRLVLSFTLSQNSPEHTRHFGEARSVLADLRPILPLAPEGRALVPYYLGLIDVPTADLRSALRRFEEAERGTERLGLTGEWNEARREHANVLSRLGKKREAIAVFQELQRNGVFGKDRCAEEQLLNDFGFLALSLSAADRAALGEAPDPRALLERALALFQQRCPGPDIAHVLTNLASAALARGEAREARARLDEARKLASSPEPRVKAGWMQIEARIAALEGRWQEASRRHEELAAFAEEASLPAYRAEAVLDRAGALDALGKVDEARKAYAEADALLDARSLQVPIGEGREGFLARHEQSARLRLDFLLRQSETARSPAASSDYLAEAASSARRSRARILASLQWTERVEGLSPEKRRAWDEAMTAYHDERAAFDADRATGKDPRAVEARLDAALALTGVAGSGAAAPLPGPAKGELILVYFPVLDGWAGLALSERGITARRLGALDLGASKEALSAQLLTPFQAALESASRLRLAPHGRLAGLDIHALPWRGRPLLAAFPVVYGVDLPQVARAPGDAALPPRALVVDDPGEDLPLARDEGSEVVRALAEKGAQVTQLSGRRATRDAVLAGLAGATFFHYSGHARFDAHHDGLESGLALAGDRRLTAGDILALPGVPRYVILSGCETGRSAEGELPQGLGLGQAFVARGAEAVVASTRVVDDALARRLMTELASHALDPAADLGPALREAQLAVSRAQPGADWATFRLLVP